MPTRDDNWNADPELFYAIWRNEFETDIDIAQKSRSVEDEYIIMDAYRSLSKEAKCFITILFASPNEFLDILIGKKVQMKKNKYQQLNKFIKKIVKVDYQKAGRESKQLKDQIETLKSELRGFAELL